MMGAIVILVSLGLFTVTAGYVMYRTSHRSALWNMVAAVISVVLVALVLILTAIILTERAFGAMAL
jgi:hypothetical protein